MITCLGEFPLEERPFVLLHIRLQKQGIGQLHWIFVCGIVQSEECTSTKSEIRTLPRRRRPASEEA